MYLLLMYDTTLLKWQNLAKAKLVFNLVFVVVLTIYEIPINFIIYFILSLALTLVYF